MTRKTLFSTMLILILGLLGACNPNTEGGTSNTSLVAWIDAPLNKSVIPLTPYEIVAHASDPAEITALEIYVNGDLQFSFINPSPDDLLVTIQQEWTPPAPGEYEIKARSQNKSGLWSQFAVVHVKVQESFSPIGLELIPTETLSLELTSCEPLLTAASNTTCRLGPSIYHLPAAYLLEGESALILGRNQDLSWWLTDLPDLQEPCWIADQTVTAVCIPEDMDIADSPPYITRVSKSNTEFYWGDHSQKTITFQAYAGGESALKKPDNYLSSPGKPRLVLSGFNKHIWRHLDRKHTRS